MNLKEKIENYKGHYLVVSTDHNDLYLGKLVNKGNEFIELKEVRRLLLWRGWTNMYELAEEGIKNPLKLTRYSISRPYQLLPCKRITNILKLSPRALQSMITLLVA